MPAHDYRRALRLLLGASALLIAGAALIQPIWSVQASGADSATLALLPYTLSDGDLPAGWTLYDTRASTNAAVAFGADDAAGTLADLEAQGRVTGLQQTFVAARGEAPPAHLVIELFRDADAASAALQALGAPANATVVPDFAAPADLPAALAQHLVLGGDDATDSYTLAWTNGALLLGATARGAHVDTSALTVIALAAAGKTGPSPAAAADVAGDAQDLATAQAFDALQLPPAAAPSGFERGGAYVWSDAQLALDSRVPADTARQAIESWGRITGEAEFFEAADRTRTTLTSGFAQFATAEGASLALHDLSLFSANRQAVLPVASSEQLGDDTVALRTVVLWPGGELRDGYVLQWRQGTVVLSVTVVEPANAAPPVYLVGVAQALDSGFMAAVQS